MSAHTPGPWTVHLHAGNSANGAAVVSHDGLVVARLPRQADRPYDVKEADMRLIAAAPDLLAALALVTDELESWVGEFEPTPTIVDQARAAIAKAEGR